MFKLTAFDPGVSRLAFATGFLFALLASGSVLAERLAHGQSPLGWLFSVAVTGGALLIVITARSRSGMEPGALWRRTRSLLQSQLIGALLALAAVHASVFALSGGLRLTEGPSQLVNDAVLVATTLGFVWTALCPAPLGRSLLPLVSAALLAGYATSMGRWHLDPFPGLGVQRYVLMQACSTSAALLLFRGRHRDAGHR